ncbi:nuclear transcription factor Y subunit A-3 isoform X1 [Nicotiana tabacum]|uniref:Nuclear transcription factor Y subunit n=8 Tax=Nicotiana tabacum TaxID=4097 RepID=A0A1S3XMJ4_TOBAC|nr:PREDICTED: nuclear transcription factor Y subunit A-3-like [Nicotiana tabacum]XP_018625958.1 nuclear transcription factor Y subunit A-3-like [Nicotiana tomentosiformis]
MISRMQDLLQKGSDLSSVSTGPSISVRPSWWTSKEPQMQQWLTFPGPQNPEQFGFHFQDQDSSSTQSTGQSCPEVATEGESKIYGKSNMPFQAGYSKSIEKPDEAQSESTLSSHEHDCTYQGNHKQIAYAPFAYSDPYCHGLLASYGQCSSVYPQMLGPISARVPLPLDYQQDEPIFVNAKQYQAILRRREYRAKLEAQNKLSKGRKPYLHESRHRHALNRARGPGGRFLNMKKLLESGSPDVTNVQGTPVSNALQLNRQIMEPKVHQSKNFQESYSTPTCSGISNGSNCDDIDQQQPLNYSAFS